MLVTGTAWPIFKCLNQSNVSGPKSAKDHWMMWNFAFSEVFL